MSKNLEFAPRLTETHRQSTQTISDAEIEEEQALILRWREHRDQQAYNQLFRKFRPLIRSIARGYQIGETPIEDLMQYGDLGLMRAIEKYECDRNMPLKIYARFWIRAKIQQAAFDLRPILTIDNQGKTARKELKRIKKKLGFSENHPLDDDAIKKIAKDMGVRTEVITSMLMAQRYDAIPLDAPKNKTDGDYRTFLDHVVDASPLPDQLAFARDTQNLRIQWISSAFATLEEHERRVMEERLLNPNKKKLDAEKLGLKKGKIERIERNASRKIRDFITAKLQECGLETTDIFYDSAPFHEDYLDLYVAIA